MKHIQLDISPSTDWSVAGHLFRKPKDSIYKAEVLKDIILDNNNTFLLFRRLEDRNYVKTIHKMSYITDEYIIYDNGQRYITPQHPGREGDTPTNLICITPSVPDIEYLIKEFNIIYNRYREEYKDLFLTTVSSYTVKQVRRTIYLNLIEQILHETD